MANTLITSDAEKIKIVFGDNDLSDKRTTLWVRRSALSEVSKYRVLMPDGSVVEYVDVRLDDDRNFDFDLTGNNAHHVDTVDGVTPSGLDDLADKIAAFIKA